MVELAMSGANLGDLRARYDRWLEYERGIGQAYIDLVTQKQQDRNFQ